MVFQNVSVEAMFSLHLDIYKDYNSRIVNTFN